jgi:hypothetical protein
MRRSVLLRIGGLIVGLWGALMVVYGFRQGIDTSGAYGYGQLTAYLFGWALAGFGLSVLIGKRRQRGPDDLDVL